MSEKLDRMKDQKEKAEQKLRYYQHQEKMLEHRIPELTRKARTHRLCTRGGMLESFLICPGELTDDQVMELLKLSFRQQEVVLALANNMGISLSVNTEGDALASFLLLGLDKQGISPAGAVGMCITCMLIFREPGCIMTLVSIN